MVGECHCCPARFLLAESHGVDSAAKETFGNVIHRSKDQRHAPSAYLIEALFEEIPWDTFERLTGRYGADDGVRSFDSRDHLIAMLGAAFGGLHGLRQTVAGLRPGSSPLRLIGSQAPRRSTLADANGRRDAGLFVDLLQAMLPRLHRTLRQEMDEVIRLIDSTQVNLGLRMRQWIGLHRNQPTAKIHMVYDPRAGQPVQFDLTSAKINDITAARRMLPSRPGRPTCLISATTISPGGPRCATRAAASSPD